MYRKCIEMEGKGFGGKIGGMSLFLGEWFFGVCCMMEKLGFLGGLSSKVCFCQVENV